MLATFDDQAVLDLEDKCVIDVELLAISLALLWWMPTTWPSSSAST